MPRPSDDDLFAEEESMPSMSFGDHIEELRTRLVLALVGLAFGVIFTFLPGLNLGARVLRYMQEPARVALDEFHRNRTRERAQLAEAKNEVTPPVLAYLSLEDIAKGLQQVLPDVQIAPTTELKGALLPVNVSYKRSEQIVLTNEVIERRNPLISLGPVEPLVNYFMVCIVTGLVLTSPWVFYQIWAFVAAGLYRHERRYMYRFLPFVLGLFLGGVFLCFFAVLPVTLDFLLKFNEWLNIEPNLRITEWIRFATILPLIFGICFQTPLVMLMLERIGIFSAEDFRSKRKIAILVMVVAAAVITPTQDPFSLGLLAVPMIVLYELGLLLMGMNKTKSKDTTPAAAAR